MRKDFGVLAVNLDFGYAFSSEASLRGGIGGICVGREVTKGREVDLELHATSTDRLGHNDALLNRGTHVDLSPHASLLLALGRDVHDTAGERSSLLTYVGVQLRW